MTFPQIKSLIYNRNSKSWIDVAPACVGFSFNQGLGSAVTQFSMTLKRNHPIFLNWGTIELRANDMVKVYLSNGGDFYPIVTPGFFSRVDKVTSFSGSGVVRNYVTNGMDVSKFAIRHTLTTNQYLDRGRDTVMDRYTSWEQFATDGASPYSIIQGILNGQFMGIIGNPGSTEIVIYGPDGTLIPTGRTTGGESIELTFPDGKTLKDYLSLTEMTDPNIGVEDDGYKAEMFNYSVSAMQEGSILQLIQQFSDPLFNELFFRPFPGDETEKTYLMFRRKPFYCTEFSTAWDDLKKSYGEYHFSVNHGVIANAKLGSSDDTVLSFWFVGPEIDSINNESIKGSLDQIQELRKGQIKIPILDYTILKEYGFSQYSESSPFIKLHGQANDSKTLDSVMRATLRMYEYNSLQYLMQDGSITIRGGAPELYVGTAAIDDDDGREYYTEGISHTWQPGSITTTAKLSRGIKPSILIQTLRDNIDALSQRNGEL